MNTLKHLSEFQDILGSYRISDDGKKLLGQVDLVLLAAPTSSGRNTIIRELLKSRGYRYIVSDTTRMPRINDGVLEQDGNQYWFRSEDDVLKDLRAGKFLEAAIIHQQQVSGISLRELETAKTQHRVAITDIEMVGVESILKAKPDTTVIFVFPPNFEEWFRRLIRRGSMDEAELKRRLRSALREFKHALNEPYYRFVINDNLQDAVEQIDRIATHKGTIRTEDPTSRKTLETLCHDTETYLQEHSA